LSHVKILTEAHVNKILITKEEDAAVATGVEFGHDGQIHTVAATKEVIIFVG
jgi:hypothetical protein